MATPDSSKNLMIKVPRLNADIFQVNSTPDGLTVLMSRRLFVVSNGEDNSTGFEPEAISAEPLILVDLSPRSAKSLQTLLARMNELYEAKWGSLQATQSDEARVTQPGSDTKTGTADLAVAAYDRGHTSPSVEEKPSPDQELAMAI